MPRLKEPSVLLDAVRDGVGRLTWELDAFAYAESYDEATGRYNGLCGGHNVLLVDYTAPGLLVKSEVAREQIDADRVKVEVIRPESDKGDGGTGATRGITDGEIDPPEIPIQTQPRRFHGTVELEPTRVGRDAGRIAEEVISHLAGIVGSRVTVTLEISAEIPSGVPEQIVRIVTENSRTLKFTNQGFERE